MNQRMGQQEIDWILKNWKNLTAFKGTLNTDDPVVDQALRERLEEHGISE
jgi:hypothetical protein